MSFRTRPRPGRAVGERGRGASTDTVEAAAYFSTVAFTTLGYGDIILAPPFRLLSAFQAANGLFLFGWSTALVFAVFQWIYRGDYKGPAHT